MQLNAYAHFDTCYNYYYDSKQKIINKGFIEYEYIKSLPTYNPGLPTPTHKKTSPGGLLSTRIN